MIHVNRTQPPQVLKDNANAWTEELLAEQDSERKKTIMNRCSNERIREALRNMFHDKCAFCERKTKGEIEHFRPKELFPEIAFAWSNLLLSCGECNRKKGSEFKETSKGETVIDPTVDDPSQHLRFEYNEVLRWVSMYGKDERGELTINRMDLNSKVLREKRFIFINKLKFIRTHDRRNSEAASILTDAFKDESEFAGAVRALIDPIIQV